LRLYNETNIKVAKQDFIRFYNIFKMLFTKKKFTEEELIRLCQKNDAKAQRDFYERFSARMMAICKRYVKDSMEAEDLMVNGFLKVFEKIHQYRFEGSFEGWLRRIFVNECLSFLRKKQLMFVDAQNRYDLFDTQQVTDLNLNVEDLLKMISQLPDGYRTVFNLYAIEGYSHQEVAEMLGISEGTSKSQLSRARAMLQQYLTENSILNVQNG
jgi:RNA polymerase sigma factor (sigma-70 family)